MAEMPKEIILKTPDLEPIDKRLDKILGDLGLIKEAIVAAFDYQCRLGREQGLFPQHDEAVAVNKIRKE